MTAWWRPPALVLLACCSLGWLDRSAAPREAARLHAEGKYDEAAARYNEALIDEPGSALLHFNLGAAEYRREGYDAALRAYRQLPDDPAARYNAGNVLYRQGQAVEGSKPQEALQRWAEALVEYRRAIAVDPADEDAKFNYEWVHRRIEELRKKLDEQAKEQQENQQDQQDQQDQQQSQGDQQDGRGQDPGDRQEQADEGEEKGGEQEDPDEPQEQAGESESEPDADRAAAEAGARAADGRMSREEAAALLDGERGEELRPDEVIRRQVGGDVPAHDW